MSNGDALFCSTCTASFRRAEHLRRHLASHSSSRPFKCHYCDSSFKRRDILRKHLQGCIWRIEQDLAMPERLSVGKKATSCDQCAYSKKGCDRKVPCSMCARKQQTCTYERQESSSNQSNQSTQGAFKSRRETDFNHDFTDDMDLSRLFSSETSTDTQWLEWDIPVGCQSQELEQRPSQSQDRNLRSQNQDQFLQSNSILDQLQLIQTPASAEANFSLQSSFDFLLNFTSKSGVNAVFNYKRQRSGCTTKSDVFQDSADPHGGITLEPGAVEGFAHRSLRATDMPPPRKRQNSVGLASFIEYFNDPIFAQTKGIWDSFRISRIRSSKHELLSADDAECTDERCLQFFCPSNLKKFTQLFWDEWYPHCPIIHKPTFDILHAPVVLLVPMVIMGACMSTISEEVVWGKEWLEFAEEIVFSCDILSADTFESEVSNADIPPLKVMQAAYITCILLNWEGSDSIKRRVRHHHFAAVVSAVREIGLSSGNHFPRDYVNGINFEWQAFIQREETIRTFTYVFLLDTAFVIFNNAPPRMVLHEMDLEMTAPEICFQADNSTSCYTYWHCYLSSQLKTPVLPPVLLAEAISILVQDNYGEYSHRFTNMSVLNLFTLVAGLHTVVFQQRSLFICLPTALLPIRNALTRWQSAWTGRADSARDNPDRESWQDTGFIGHAQEFAWLGLAQLNALESSIQARSGTIGDSAPIVKPTSGRLDDTRMSLVTGLMLSLTVSER